LRKIVAPAIVQLYLLSLYLTLPLMPLLASILFMRGKYVLEYRATLRKVRIHIAALKEGPAQHYFHDVMGRGSDVPQEIHGECVQCGNCCMERRCVFLEPIPLAVSQALQLRLVPLEPMGYRPLCLPQLHRISRDTHSPVSAHQHRTPRKPLGCSSIAPGTGQRVALSG
jgi:hypothetical protein